MRKIWFLFSPFSVYLPDGLIKRSTKNLAAVFRETEARNTFTVCSFKSSQTLTTLDFPHLKRKQQVSDYFAMRSHELKHQSPCMHNPFLAILNFPWVYTEWEHYCYCKLIFLATTSPSTTNKKICTLIFPSCAPVASISVSLLKHMHSTASSIIMKLSCAWYFRSYTKAEDSLVKVVKSMKSILRQSAKVLTVLTSVIFYNLL